MNYNQQFDEHIREQFSNYAPDVHPRIWENIIAEKERRKPVGFWISFFNNRNRLILAGLLIAISTAGTWFYMNNDLTSSTIKTAGKENNIKEENRPGTDKNKTTGDHITAGQPNSELSLNEDKTTATGNTVNGKDITSSDPGAAKFSISSPSLQDNDEQNSTGNKISSKKRYTGLGSTLLIVNTASPDLDEDDLAGQGSLLGRLTFDAEKISASRKKKNPPLLSFRPINYLPGCPSIEKNAAGNKRYFEIYGGPDYAFRSMSDTGNSTYLQKRKESEKFKSAFSAGIRYTRVFNNSMSVRGGINYSQINEKFTYTQGNLVQVTYIIDANGDTTGTYLTTGTRYKTTINKYRSIDIPVMVGYEVGNGKLHANINAGVVVNVYSWQKGEVLDRSLNPVNITTGKSSSPYQFKTNAGLGFMGAASVYYKLTDRIHIMAEPYFRYNFTPMNKESITLKQKYHTAGLRLGVRLDLK
jgi:hypothetical protein